MRNKPAKLLYSFSRAQSAPSTSNAAYSARSLPRDFRRHVSIQATPSSLNPTIDASDPSNSNLSSHSPSDAPDARFEVLGSTSSLLSVALAASQTLYTRRGTLAGMSGSPENATSTLSTLSPLTRGVVGIPFLYQKISSPTPLNLLVTVKAPHTSFSVIQLDGRLDWTIAQRTGVVAWTGHTLSVKPTVNYTMSLAHWGNSLVTGRGLVALAASGNTYQITLKPGEQYIAHPSHVLAYTMSSKPPQPYRFNSTAFRFSIPSVRNMLPDNDFLRQVRKTAMYKFVANALFTMRTWSRRTIWADRLFVQFQGPASILLQSRGSSIRDVLTSREMNEIADSPAGFIQPASSIAGAGQSQERTVVKDAVNVPPVSTPAQQSSQTTMSYARVRKDGKVAFSNS